MTPTENEHLKTLLLMSNELLTNKYIKGREKHKEDKKKLEDMTITELNEEALQENSDQRFYLLEQKLKIHALKAYTTNGPRVDVRRLDPGAVINISET